MSTRAILDLPAIFVTAAVTMVLLKGIRESATINVVIVALKLAVVLFVIAVGAFYVTPDNWRPFAPFGFGGSASSVTRYSARSARGEPLGMLAGAATIFFAYHRVRCGIGARGGGEAPAARSPHRHRGLARHLHHAVRRRRGDPDRHGALPPS